MARLEKDKNVTKKKNPFLRFLKVIGIVFLSIILILACWIGFSSFDRTDNISLLPNNYSFYIRSDKVWKSINPLLDIQAADIFLASDSFSSLRSSFMALRQSSLRTNKLFTLVANRAVDAAFYTNENGGQSFVAVIDMGMFSAITRLAKFWFPRLPLSNIENINISSINNSRGTYFELNNGQSSFYFTPYKNTVLVSSDFKLFSKAWEGKHDVLYTPDELKLIKAKTKEPIKIIADANKLALIATEGSDMLNKMTSLVHTDSKALISFDISDYGMSLSADIPLNLSSLEKQELSDTNKDLKALVELLKIDSTMPSLLSKLGKNVQYYTIINSGTLTQLKNGVFPFLPDNIDAPSLWKSASNLSKNVLGLTLEDLIFSWAGKEIAAVGIEGLNTPAFAIQIEDEKKRQQVFDKALSSIVISDDTSLILNGVRLPRIYFPPFIQGLLNLFKISLPKPYYIVNDGFVYFSESPETLAAIVNATLDNKKIASNENWDAVSEKHNLNSTVSLFYDLERSRPFFLRGNNLISNILELYSIGRLDANIKSSVLRCHLTVISRQAGQLQDIPGFPLTLKGRASQLCVEPSKKPQFIFWVENENVIKSFNLSSTEIAEKKMTSRVKITPVAEKNKTQSLWATTEEGAVYLLSGRLEEENNFPILLDSQSMTSPLATQDGIVQVMQDDSIMFISSKGEKDKMPIEVLGSIRSTPTLLDNTLALYDKGFTGNILLLDIKEKVVQESIQIAGLSYGSPSLLRKKNILYMAFITQNGNLKIWQKNESTKNSTMEETVNTNLSGLFFTNVVSNGNYFFALSSEGYVYCITTDGNNTVVKIPDFTAREGMLTVIDSSSSGVKNIYVGVDGNLIYGFNETLSLLSGFPVTGKGTLVFADVNGDNYNDCFTISIDNKLNALNLR